MQYCATPFYICSTHAKYKKNKLRNDCKEKKKLNRFLLIYIFKHIQQRFMNDSQERIKYIKNFTQQKNKTCKSIYIDNITNKQVI